MEKWPALGRMFGKKEEQGVKREGKEGKLEIVCAYVTEASERHPKRNGDSFFIDTEKLSVGVFDGMSMPYGDQLASRACAEYVKSNIDKITDGTSVEKALRIMEEILEGANSVVAEPERYKEEREIYQSMGGDMDKMPGTTASVFKIHTDNEGIKRTIIGNVGNSRIYKIGESGTLTQLTEDNDILELYYGDKKQRALVSRKFSNIKNVEELSDDKEKLAFKKKNLLSMAIGTGIDNAQTLSLEVKTGDRFLLLTDGILNLTTIEMEEIISKSKNAQKTVEVLLDRAKKEGRKSKKENARANPDDMTAVVVEIK